MNNSFNSWEHIKDVSLDKVVDLVITNGTVDSIHPDEHLYYLLGDPLEHRSILDFGCGIGRNMFHMANIYPAWNIYGYDNPQMLSYANEYCLAKYGTVPSFFTNLQLFDNWEQISDRKFDVIFATLVFQHIHENDLTNYLQQFKQMTSKLIVAGRRFNDDMESGEYKKEWILSV